jgi:TolB-like protein/Flp pilus assembly protein TadD
MSEKPSFFVELKRRNVYRAAVAYGVVAWFLTQLTTQVFPFFEIPNSAVRFVVIALTVGFPIAMLLSWLYELTPEGIVRTEDLDPVQARSVQRATGRILDFIIIGVLLLVIAMMIVGGRPFYRQTGESISQKSIAVLPFEDLSEDKANAYFADGTQNEILTKLAGIGDLKVISRTSSAKYKSKPEDLKTVARELGVATVLEGSVQKAGGKVRVNVQLLDARSDTHLWAKSYDRKFNDIFAVESDVAQEVAETLRAKLSSTQTNVLAAAPTRDTEAYDLYLKGEYQERQAESTYKAEIYDRAATFYRQALARDPNFVLAYARLAYNRLHRHWFVNRLTSAQLGEVKSEIERALAIAPDSPEAHLALGMFHYWGRHDFDSALKEFDRAVELQPSNSVSRQYRAAIYSRRGEWQRSLAEYERAAELDPRDVWIPDQIGAKYLSVRRWSDAEHWLKHALALDPHHVGAAYRLNLTYIASTGDIQRARRAWEGIPNDKTDVGEGPASPYEIIIPQMVGEIEYLDVLERHFPEALKPWDAAPTDTAEGCLVRLKARIGIQVLAGQSAAAKSEAEEARALLEPRLAERAPEDRTSLSESAWVYVCLGRNADALHLAREAAESMPIEKDAILGVNFLVGLAQIEAHTGQSEEAVKLLRQLLTMPAGEYISVARLKIDPLWDPIRRDPGFQKLISEPESETIYK